MPCKPRSKPTVQSNALLDAVRFVGTICKDVGVINETHIFLANEWVCASNSVLTLACPAKSALLACPQYKFLSEALSKSAENYSIAYDDKKLSIKAGKFKAVIPCLPSVDLLVIPSPDDPTCEVNNTFKSAIEAVSVLTNENAQNIYSASILLNGKSAIATLNGAVIMEYWHGINLPEGLSIPKSLVTYLSKLNKNLVKFGFSENSITLYFEDNSWIKSQLYRDPWPDVNAVLNRPSNPWPLLADFWTGFDAVAPFGEGHIYLDTGIMRSHAAEGTGAEFQVAGIPRGPVLSVKQLALLRPFIEQIDFFAPGPEGSTMIAFFGKNCRGVIAGNIT